MSMSVAEHGTQYFSRGFRSAPQDLDFDLLQPVKSSRGTAISLLIVAWIAIVDFYWTRTNLSILYVVPLLVLAWTDNLRPLWRAAGLLVGLTYGVYFLKNAMHDGMSTASYFDYRLVNRTLSAITLIVLGRILLGWIDWRRELGDSEVPEFVRRQDQEISATLAALCSAPLIALIAAIDFYSPANYNLAILYPIPLFVCGWTSNLRLLWGMLAVLLMLTAVAYVVGPPASNAGDPSLTRNRILAGVGMLGVTVMLSYWMKDSEATDS